MSDWRCTYDKTLNGRCDQQARPDSDYCYYHEQVVGGLIETDEKAVMRSFQTASR